ncbi:MAG TPA: DUF6174 domain-containing protein [Flavobacterium sp.]|nr:DUF6174 domain-containing protein [Flavobacterium sp.]
MKTRLLLLIAFLGIIMVSCDKEEDAVYYRFDEAKFVAKQKQWNEQDLQNYQYVQSYYSSTTGPVSETIVVRNGIASSENETRSAMIGTISDVYTRVINDFNQGKTQQNLPINGISVDVTYNEDYSYPEDIKFTTSYKEAVAGGAWYDLKISDFEILE